jgi:hypothetical protein
VTLAFLRSNPDTVTLAGSSEVFLSPKLAPKIFFLPNTAASTKTKLPNHKITFGTSNWHKYFSILEKAVDSNNNLFSTKLQTVPTRK